VPEICAPGLEGREETSNILHSEHIFVWYCNTSESKLQIPEKFLNVLLEKEGEAQLDRTRENEVLHTVKGERNILHTIQRRKAN